jgi:hypothetical protein
MNNNELNYETVISKASRLRRMLEEAQDLCIQSSYWEKLRKNSERPKKIDTYHVPGLENTIVFRFQFSNSK